MRSIKSRSRGWRLEAGCWLATVALVFGMLNLLKVASPLVAYGVGAVALILIVVRLVVMAERKS